MSSCSSSCPTQDHSSYGECIRAKGAQLSGLRTGTDSYRRDAKWESEIKEYRAARSQGIQPRSTRLNDIRGAVERSRATDTAVKEYG